MKTLPKGITVLKRANGSFYGYRVSRAIAKMQFIKNFPAEKYYSTAEAEAAARRALIWLNDMVEKGTYRDLLTLQDTFANKQF